MAGIVPCGQRLQNFYNHIETIHSRRSLQFVVAKGQSISKASVTWPGQLLRVNKSLRGIISKPRVCHYSSLWPKAKTFEQFKRGYSRPEVTTVRCGQRPKHLNSSREAIRGRRSSQFVVAKGLGFVILMQSISFIS